MLKMVIILLITKQSAFVNFPLKIEAIKRENVKKANKKFIYFGSRKN